MLTVSHLFSLEHTLAADYLGRYEYGWQALCGLKSFIYHLGSQLSAEEYEEIKEKVWIHRSARVADSAFLSAPCIIGAESEVRHGAFIRGSALIGESCVVGNSTEIKNAILFDGVQAPHYNYVGDSILGYKAHMGAGSITSNVKSDRTYVCVNIGENRTQTGLRKFGAMVGDHVEIGCNSVLNPGTVIGKNSSVYPLTAVRGFVPANAIVKAADCIVSKKM